LGREGGAAVDADAVLVAVPSGQIAAALDKVSGLEGKVAIDATNAFDGRDEAYQSLAHEVKAIIGGPVAKAFNLQHAALYDRIDEQPVRPSNIYDAEDGAREAAEALSRDAGYEPLFAGGLEQARVLEDAVELFGAIRRAGGGPYFHRFAWRDWARAPRGVALPQSPCSPQASGHSPIEHGMVGWTSAWMRRAPAARACGPVQPPVPAGGQSGRLARPARSAVSPADRTIAPPVLNGPNGSAVPPARDPH
jgi:hypothetical protein